VQGCSGAPCRCGRADETRPRTGSVRYARCGASRRLNCLPRDRNLPSLPAARFYGPPRMQPPRFWLCRGWQRLPPCAFTLLGVLWPTIVRKAEYATGPDHFDKRAGVPSGGYSLSRSPAIVGTPDASRRAAIALSFLGLKIASVFKGSCRKAVTGALAGIAVM